MSKRRSSSTKPPPDPRIVTDRSIGRYELIKRVKDCFSEIVCHDQIFHDRVRDPELLYCCGKMGWVVLTSDLDLLAGVPHRAAIELGSTAVFAFTNNHSGAETWAGALRVARKSVLRRIRHKQPPYMAKIGLDGEVRPVDLKPNTRRASHPRDQESFERALRYEQENQNKPFTIPSWLRRGGK